MNDSFLIPGNTGRQSVLIEDGTPVGYQQLTVSSTAVALTIPSGANRAIIQIEPDGDIRWRDDAVAPTSLVGNHLFAGNSLVITNNTSLKQFQAIRQSTVDVVMNINYYLK